MRETLFWCLLYFLCFGSEITISLPLFPKIFCYFLWIIFWSCFYWKKVCPGRKVNNNIIILSRRYIYHQFQNWESQKFMLIRRNIFFQAKIQQWHFPNVRGDRQSQKWPTKRQHTLPWKASLITPCWRERASPSSVPSAERECISYVLAPLQEKGASLPPPPPQSPGPGGSKLG